VEPDVPGTRFSQPDEKGRIVTAIREHPRYDRRGIGAGWSQVIPRGAVEVVLTASRAVRVPGAPVAVRNPSRAEVDFAGNA